MAGVDLEAEDRLWDWPARYAADESIRHIAATCGVPYRTVRDALVKAGVKLRPRGGRRHSPGCDCPTCRSVVTGPEVQGWLRMIADGVPVDEVIKSSGRGRSTVERILREAGLHRPRLGHCPGCTCDPRGSAAVMTGRNPAMADAPDAAPNTARAEYRQRLRAFYTERLAEVIELAGAQIGRHDDPATVVAELRQQLIDLGYASSGDGAGIAAVAAVGLYEARAEGEVEEFFGVRQTFTGGATYVRPEGEGESGRRAAEAFATDPGDVVVYQTVRRIVSDWVPVDAPLDEAAVET